MPGTLVMPDSGAFVFAVSGVPYGFLAGSHRFWGAGTDFMQGAQGGVQNGSASITAKIDEHRNVLWGSVLICGGIPAKNIPDRSPLLHGAVVWVAAEYAGSHFWASFLFQILFSHSNLSYASPFGVWDAYFSIPGWTAANLGKLFTQEWGPAHAPLNSYIGQVKCFF